MKVRRVAACFVLLCTMLVIPPAEAQLTGASITLAVIPDTQRYVESDAGAAIFRAQFEWIVDERDARNIVFVTHEGDVAQEADVVEQWDRIESAYVVLDAAEVPYGIAPGNHDMKVDGTAREYDARFGIDRYVDKPWFGGNHEAEGNRSNYQTITVEGHNLLFLHLRHLQPQFGDVDAVLTWADGVIESHPNHLVFVTTHEFTSSTGETTIPDLAPMLQSNCNVVAVFSGHRSGEAARGSFDDACGRTVHHVLTNYQFLSSGGQGFFRLVTIDPATLIADFSVYSPTRNEFREGVDESFTVQLAPLVPILGDATCDRSVNVFDAFAVSQFAAQIGGAAATCPLTDPAAQINLSNSDANNDGLVNVFDAFVIAECAAGVANELCPA